MTPATWKTQAPPDVGVARFGEIHQTADGVYRISGTGTVGPQDTSHLSVSDLLSRLLGIDFTEKEKKVE